MLLGDHAPAIESTLPVALLAEAQRLALLGAYRMAVVIASSAVDILNERKAPLTNGESLARWRQLEHQLSRVRSQDDQPEEDFVLDVLSTAEQLIGNRQDQALSPSLLA